jgi:AbrB family looped-hinge helix DNA binding protein
MQEFIVTISNNGRVTIPDAIRKHLGITANDTIVFVIDDEGSVHIRVSQFPATASLRGAAESLEQPLTWQRIREIANEDRFNRKDADA